MGDNDVPAASVICSSSSQLGDSVYRRRIKFSFPENSSNVDAVQKAGWRMPEAEDGKVTLALTPQEISIFLERMFRNGNEQAKLIAADLFCRLVFFSVVEVKPEVTGVRIGLSNWVADPSDQSRAMASGSMLYVPWNNFHNWFVSTHGEIELGAFAYVEEIGVC